MKVTYLILLLISSAYAFAQPDQRNREKMEAYRIAFITDKLDLSSAEAEKFWPVYNEFEKQMRELKRKQRELAKEINSNTDKTDAIAEKRIQQQLSLRSQEHELVKKYIPEFKKVLPAYKVAILLTLDEQFKQEVIRQMQGKNKPGPPKD
jgi:hypothetical protein